MPSTAFLDAPPAPALVPADHVHDLIATVARLERDNKSLVSRTRAMEAALSALRPRAQDLPTRPAVVGVFGQGQTVAQIVAAAQTTEALGSQAAIRFVRNAHGSIVGVEIDSLSGPEDDDADDGAFDPTFRMLALLATERVSA